jgi:pimeloyl-ACP methyl ester carboxylesterase
MGVYRNWFKNDPWFLVRSYAHLMHPRSPLSSTPLVHSAFFSQACPEENVREFERWMSPWESMLWPLYMMRSFVSFPRVVQNITGWNRGSRICVVAGTQDKLMGVVLIEKLADCLRAAVKENAADKKIDSPKDVEEGVKLVIVRDAGHHLQNDSVWGDGARQLLEFFEALN